MIAPGRSHIANEQCRRYFTPYYRRIDICPVPKSPSAASDHVRIHKPLAERAIVDKPLTQDFEPCKGQIKNWLHSLTHIKSVSKGDPVFMLERSDSLRKPGDDLQILDLDPCHSYH